MQYTTVLLLLALCVADTHTKRVKWSVADQEHLTCVILSAERVSLRLNIATGENTTELISFAIDSTSHVKGACNGSYKGAPANILRVSFFPDAFHSSHGERQEAIRPWRLSLWFTAGPEGSTGFALVDWALETAPFAQFNSTAQRFNKSASASDADVHASDTHGFACAKTRLELSNASSIDLADAKVIANAVLDMDDFPEGQAFEQCRLRPRTPASVPIVVGLCLALLVALVLCAYRAGLARNRLQGYASV